jgi:hypothetical protein
MLWHRGCLSKEEPRRGPSMADVYSGFGVNDSRA